MAKPKLTVEQINIGDIVHYEDDYLNKNYFEWIVVAKLGDGIMIELTKDGRIEKRVIDITEVIKIVPQSLS
jgi:hypothetical protein